MRGSNPAMKAVKSIWAFVQEFGLGHRVFNAANFPE